MSGKRRALTDAERAEAAAAAPRKTIDKLFALQAVLADQRTSKTEATVLGVLIEATNKSLGCAWPALGSIAAAAGIGKRATINALHKLEKCGYVLIDEGGGRGFTNRYYVRGERVHDDAPLRVNERAPLSLLRRPDESDQKGEPICTKGEPICTKGCTVTSERVNGRAPDPLLEPSYDPAEGRIPSDPAAHTQSVRASPPPCGDAKDEEPKSAKPNGVGDPFTSLAKSPTAFLVRVERRIDRGPKPTHAELSAWYDECYALWDENGEPDPLGSHASRLLDKIDELPGYRYVSPSERAPNQEGEQDEEQPAAADELALRAQALDLDGGAEAKEDLIAKRVCDAMEKFNTLDAETIAKLLGGRVTIDQVKLAQRRLVESGRNGDSHEEA